MRDRRTFLLPLVLVVVTTLGVLAYATRAFEGLERDSINQRFAARGDRTPPRDLVVVQIDDKTFSELRLQWPFPRSVHAQVIDRISADRPKVIAYDVQFSEASAPRLVQLASSRTAAILKLTRPKARRALTRIGDDETSTRQRHPRLRWPHLLSFTETNAQGQANLLGGGPDPLSRSTPGRATGSSRPIRAASSAASPTRSTG